MKNNYIVELRALTSNDAFREASVEEMRVLLTLISHSDDPLDSGDISRLANVSGARCRAAIAFWEGAGVLRQKRYEGIVEEFEERLAVGELDETPSIEVAKTIRDEGLALLMNDCASIMGVPHLSPREVHNIANLVSQYGVTPDYVLTLAASMQAKGEVKIKILCDRAVGLMNKGIDTTEKLDDYLKQLERGYEYEYRRVMGIYGRALSKTERECYRKWSEDFGYSAEIISEAYNIAVLGVKDGKGYFAYMDRVLSDWHEAGCRTAAECLSRSEATKPSYKEKTEKKYAKSKPETPRYGNFDVNEAFERALERSYGKKED